MVDGNLPNRPGRRVVFWVRPARVGSGSEALSIVGADTPEDAPSMPMPIRDLEFFDEEDQGPFGRWIERLGDLL